MIGEILAEVRKDHGDTQESLAKKLHVTVSAVRTWEQEKSSPSQEMLVTICQLYNVSADYWGCPMSIPPMFSNEG